MFKDNKKIKFFLYNSKYLELYQYNFRNNAIEKIKEINLGLANINNFLYNSELNIYFLH